MRRNCRVAKKAQTRKMRAYSTMCKMRINMTECQDHVHVPCIAAGARRHRPRPQQAVCGARRLPRCGSAGTYLLREEALSKAVPKAVKKKNQASSQTSASSLGSPAGSRAAISPTASKATASTSLNEMRDVSSRPARSAIDARILPGFQRRAATHTLRGLEDLVASAQVINVDDAHDRIGAQGEVIVLGTQSAKLSVLGEPLTLRVDENDEQGLDSRIL
jgi:hypothetical protein